MSKVYYDNIEQQTKNNSNYRQVVFTDNLQLVLMSIKPKEEIGEEIHPHTDQFFRIESGKGKAIVDGKTYKLRDGVGLIIPKNTKHNIINTHSTKELKLYTIYAPPDHPADLIEKNKTQEGGDYEKYLKFKKKYLNLKHT